MLRSEAGRNPHDKKLVELNFEAMELPSSPGLTLLVYTAPQGSPTADSLKLLAGWAATAEPAGELTDGEKTISTAD